MKKIIISGEIGWDIMPFMIRNELNEANGGDVEFDMSSPGGFLFDGIEIYNLIRDYKRDNPKSQMIMNIKSEAASMGSYIASNPVFDLITVEDNASHMIHNPLMVIIGDHNEMRKATDFLERLAVMIAPSYANRSGKSIEETRSDMDEETWLFGEEIVKAGFADEVIKTKSGGDKKSSRAMAELKVKAVNKKIREREWEDGEFEKVAAIVDKHETITINKTGALGKSELNINSTQPASGGENNNQEVIVNKDELKTKHPDIYAEVTAEGKEAGIDQEKDDRSKRIEALIKMKDNKDFEGIPEIMARIDEGILKDESVQTVELGIFAILRNPAIKAVMDTNDIGNLNPDGSSTVSGEKGKSKSDDKGEF